MKIQSNAITFIDQTDSRKLEIYIKSNLPTVQIYNKNESGSEEFTPNWENDKGLELKADVFLDSRKIEENYSSTYSVKWYKEDIVVAKHYQVVLRQKQYSLLHLNRHSQLCKGKNDSNNDRPK